MATTIWKFQIETTDTQKIDMPFGAEILTLQMQKGIPTIWAIVEPSNSPQSKIIETFGTGHPIKNLEHRKYIGSYQLSGGSLVFHVFEHC